MAAVYGGQTINGIASKGNALIAQDMIGTSPALRANASSEFQNGHIGAGENVVTTPAARAAMIAATGTPAIDGNGTLVSYNATTGVWS